jgi:hypothetical protein
MLIQILLITIAGLCEGNEDLLSMLAYQDVPNLLLETESTDLATSCASTYGDTSLLSLSLIGWPIHT